MAELEEMEQEDLERDLLDVEAPSNPLTDPLEDLPEVRKWILGFDLVMVFCRTTCVYKKVEH